MPYGFTAREINVILFRTVRNVTAFPALIFMETHARSAALTIYRFLMSNFTPKSENKCGYMSTATNLRPEVGTTSTAPTFTELSQSFSDIVCATTIQNVVLICQEIRTVDRKFSHVLE
jgi:hypothetical protein